MNANDLTKFCIEIRHSKLYRGHSDRSPGSVYNKWRDWNGGADEYGLCLPQYTKIIHSPNIKQQNATELLSFEITYTKSKNK